MGELDQEQEQENEEEQEEKRKEQGGAHGWGGARGAVLLLFPSPLLIEGLGLAPVEEYLCIARCFGQNLTLGLLQVTFLCDVAWNRQALAFLVFGFPPSLVRFYCRFATTSRSQLPPRPDQYQQLHLPHRHEAPTTG